MNDELSSSIVGRYHKVLSIFPVHTIHTKPSTTCLCSNSSSLCSHSFPRVLEKTQSRPGLRLGPRGLGGRGGEKLLWFHITLYMYGDSKTLLDLQQLKEAQVQTDIAKKKGYC